jgi:hypothetical protein
LDADVNRRDSGGSTAPARDGDNERPTFPITLTDSTDRTLVVEDFDAIKIGHKGKRKEGTPDSESTPPRSLPVTVYDHESLAQSGETLSAYATDDGATWPEFPDGGRPSTTPESVSIPPPSPKNANQDAG